MATKHVFNDADGLVVKALRGSAALNPTLRVYVSTPLASAPTLTFVCVCMCSPACRYEPDKVLYDASHDPAKVSVIAGGGAGHEPGHAGVVGNGMLAACVSGDIFASPSTVAIVTGIDLAPSDKGYLIVVNNYTGDVLNFGLAAEKTRAALAYANAPDQGHEGVEVVNIADDVAVGRKKGGLVGRRGLAVNILTCKAVGAAAAQGWKLKDIASVGREIVSHAVTIQVGLDHCHVPGRPKKPEDYGALPPDALEIGMGIHNEPGVKRVDHAPPPAELVRDMLAYLLNEADADRAYVHFDRNDAPIVIINNLGGLSNLEISAVVDEVLGQLEKDYGLYPSRVYAHPYMTSLNAPGFGISLVNQRAFAHKTGVDLLALLDAPTDAPGWAGVAAGWGAASGRPRDRDAELREAKDALARAQRKKTSVSKPQAASDPGGPVNASAEQAKKVIVSACDSAVAAEPDMTKFDTVVGDGDAGETLAQAAKAVKKAALEGALDLTSAGGTCLSVDAVIEHNMGGTSGALYALFFTSLAKSVIASAPKGAHATSKEWGAALLAALESLGHHTPARPGMRTLVDALDPFCRVMADTGSLRAAVDAARNGALATRDQTARLGRATYVGDVKDAPPDPGAWGVVALVDGILHALE